MVIVFDDSVCIEESKEEEEEKKVYVINDKMINGQRRNYYRLIGAGFLCILMFSLVKRFHQNPAENDMQIISARKRALENPLELENADNSPIALNQIQQVLNVQRRLIREEMIDYQYPNGRKLDDLVLENGGKPIRSVVISTWRSGSSFFGDILNTHPAQFYSYEPLNDFGIVVVRGSPRFPQSVEALERVKAILNCEYAGSDRYLKFAKDNSWSFRYNERLRRQCQAHENLCYDHRFLSGMCKLFPFQLMKLVRLKLRVAQELLADKELDIRLVLLVRDPRGSFQSRKHTTFCPRSPDCSDPALLCSDLLSDYNIAVELQKKYPTRFKVVRYEDLSLEPYKYVDELTKFYGLSFHPSIKNFLDTHTTKNVGDPYSTFRDSKKAPFHWRTDLEFEEVKEVQRLCAVAMNRWGYVPAMNATHQREFNPLTNYTLDL